MAANKDEGIILSNILPAQDLEEEAIKAYVDANQGGIDFSKFVETSGNGIGLHIPRWQGFYSSTGHTEAKGKFTKFICKTHGDQSDNMLVFNDDKQSVQKRFCQHCITDMLSKAGCELEEKVSPLEKIMGDD